MAETEINVNLPSPESRSSGLSKLALGVSAGCLAIGGGVVAMERGWFKLWNLDFFETTTTVRGSGSDYRHNIVPPSEEIAVFYQSGAAKVESDVWGPAKNPEAKETSINKLSVMFDSHYRPLAERNYSETEGPFFEVTAKGSPSGGFDYSNVYVMPYKPEICELDGNGGQRPEFINCTDPDDPSYRGATNIQSTDGSPINSNYTIVSDLMRYSDVFRRNNWCFFSYMLGGVYEGKVEEGSVTGDRLLLQARVVAMIRATYKRSVAEQKNVPVSMVKLSEDIAILNGATSVVLEDGIRYEVRDNMFYPVVDTQAVEDMSEWINKFVPVDNPAMYEALQLRDEMDTVRLPEVGNTFRDAASHPLSRTCEPGSDEAERRFALMLDDAIIFGGVEVQHGLWANGVVDVEAAEARIAELSQEFVSDGVQND